MKKIEKEIADYLYSYGTTDMTEGFCKLLAKELMEDVVEQFVIKARIEVAEHIQYVQYDTAELRIYIAELKKELEKK